MLYKPAEKVISDGDWIVSSEVSKIDDSKNIFVRLESENLAPKRFGGSAPVVILFRCMENTTAFYFAMDNFLSDIQGYGEITIRLDDERAFEKRFQSSTDNSALGLWNGGVAIPFFKATARKAANDS